MSRPKIDTAPRETRATAGDPLAGLRPADPYAELGELGLTYDSSMADVHRAGLEAQRREALTPARRRAWAELRNAERRLALDLLYLRPNVWSREGEGSAPAAAGPEAGPDLWSLLEECWEEESEDFGPLPQPGSFLEDE